MMKKILIVDDEPLVVKLLSKHLKANGYETIGTYDVSQCIKMAKEEKPDLILLDLNMPPAGGISAFKNLKTSLFTSMIPIIFITGVPGKEVKKLIMDLGADGYFPKPFKFDELLKKIDELLRSN
jgi:DNA-binding response OmpR family regulator